MYYEETVIEGRWYWRGIPNGEWTLFSQDKLCEKIEELRAENAGLRGALERARVRPPTDFYGRPIPSNGL